MFLTWIIYILYLNDFGIVYRALFLNTCSLSVDCVHVHSLLGIQVFYDSDTPTEHD